MFPIKISTDELKINWMISDESKLWNKYQVVKRAASHNKNIIKLLYC